ncbi:MAG: tetratricopeptide repeat protein [Verrucomicrobiota bacterium]
MTREINPKLFDYAYFRIGKAFKALEEFDEMESHYRQFLTIREGSPRLTEALSHLAWLKRRDGEKEEAAQLYWEAIHNYGNDPEAQAVEEMFRILAKFYRGDEGKAQYLSLLTELEAKAGNQSQKTLVARAIWMQAQLSEVERADGLLARLPDVVQKRELSPILLADTGDALRRLGQGDEARECYRTILSWYPRSLFKDRSFAGLGLLARSSGQDAEALDYFDQFERETVQSPLWAKVLEARAEIYIDQGKWEKAIEEWSRILEVKSAKGLPWVEALYQIGATYQKYDQPKKAIPYYQRIYVLYRRWDQFVAKAYLESGQAFEALRMTDEARNTYKEFLENTHLKEKPEYQQAETRLASLGGAS